MSCTGIQQTFLFGKAFPRLSTIFCALKEHPGWQVESSGSAYSSASCSQPAGDTSKDESRRMSWVGYGMDLAQLLKRRSLFSRWVTRPTGYELVMGRVKGEEVPGQ